MCNPPKSMARHTQSTCANTPLLYSGSGGSGGGDGGGRGARGCGGERLDRCCVEKQRCLETQQHIEYEQPACPLG